MSDFDRFAWANAWAEDPRVKGGVMNTLTILFLRAGRRDGASWPSQSYIAERVGKSERSVRNYIKKAEELGYIKSVPRSGNSTLYIPQTPDSDPGNQLPPRQPIARDPGNSLPTTPATSFQGAPRQPASTPEVGYHPPRQPASGDPGNPLPINSKRTDLDQSREEEGPSTPPKSDLVDLDSSKPFAHPQTGERLSYDELLNVRHPEHLIRTLADHFKIPVAAGTEMVIWSRTKDEIGNEQKARKYIGAKMTSLGAGDDAARRKYSPRGVMEWIPGDAKKWLKNEEMPKQELKKRGDVRNTGFMDTDLAKRFT